MIYSTRNAHYPERKIMAIWKLTLLLLFVSLFALTGCSDDDDDPVIPAEAPELDYAGSAACGACHTEKHTNWSHSGHPYKLTKINGEAPSSFPDPSRYFQNPIEPPVGTEWADFSYTIGGFGWKMRWIKNDGYIYTPDTGQNQYNFENETWGNYHAGEEKQYDCGACHTTGWVGSDDGNAENNQDGMEGFWGTFVEGGIGCENCHGMGNQHVFDNDTYDMTIDASAEFCGKCHTRGGDNGVTPGETVIEAAGWPGDVVGDPNYIKHHEQYDEWYNSPHNTTYGPDCNACHDPHSSVKFDATAPGEGVSTTVTCIGCHVEGDHANIEPTSHHGATCNNCHMPDASKSAIANSAHAGDVSTHLWKINTSVNGKVDMFSADGKTVIIGDDGYAAVTLDFACYGCHKDPEGNGGDGIELTLEQLAEKAPNIHTLVSDKIAAK
jgi:predicted CXXCH cytochrome family protein